MRTRDWNRWVGLLWLSSLVGSWLLFAGDGDAYSARVAGARALGYHAWALLSAALCVSPLQRLLGTLGYALSGASLRRALGLAAWASGLLHAFVGALSSPLSIGAQLDDPHLRFGVGALGVLCVLGATSFSPVVRSLRLRSWKELHRLAYVAWGCATAHALLGPYAWTRGLLTLALVIAGFGLLRLLPRRERSTEV